MACVIHKPFFRLSYCGPVPQLCGRDTQEAVQITSEHSISDT